MADIAPELYEKIKESFDRKYAQAQLFGGSMSEMVVKINNGTATFQDANIYASMVGGFMADAMKENLILDELPGKRLYSNIARKTIGEGLKDTYGIVSAAAKVAQAEHNAAAKIGLKPVQPKLETKRVDNIVNKAAAAKTQQELNAMIETAVPTFARQVVDDTQKANARQHNKAGLAVKVEREYDGVGLHDGTDVCDWCLQRAGTWTYDKAIANGVFERHEGCGCIIDYTSKKGEKSYSTDKYTWHMIKDPADYEERIQVGQRIMSGARIIDPNGEYEQRWAKSYYEEIRHKSTDCAKIAKRLGMEKSDIEAIKDYLFFTGTWYNEITEKYEPFVPDPAIAQSWQRLAEANEVAPHDILLIQHEQYEMLLKKEQPEITHDEAHALATRKYDYQGEADKYYANLRERKKR